jgi:hypothetical protein
MSDAAPISQDIARLIATGTDEHQLLAVLSPAHPDVGPHGFAEVLQVGAVEAECRAQVRGRR